MSDAMQYLSQLSEIDTSGGQAVIPPRRRLAYVLQETCLTEDEQHFLWDLFDRHESILEKALGAEWEDNAAPITAEEEARADQLIKKLRAK